MNFFDANIYEAAKSLIKEAGFDSHIKIIEPIHQGGNNKLFHIRLDHQDFILKKYFQHNDDRRNRLATEYSFLEFAHAITPEYVPKPYAKIDHDCIALYEFIDGKKLESEKEIKIKHIYESAQFISKLNTPKTSYLAILSNASEACFSIHEHLNVIDMRLNELNVNASTDYEFESVIDEIRKKWGLIKRKVLNECSIHKIDVNETLPNNKKIISPSDFGFHNAIIAKSGGIKFIDFEYSGWDDPAKLVGDFFGQVAIPINKIYLDNFIEHVFKGLQFTKVDLNRIKFLMDAYKIKWCCIVLNIFIEKNLNRRIFSNPSIEISNLKTLQVNKARKILESLTHELY